MGNSFYFVGKKKQRTFVLKMKLNVNQQRH